MDLLQQISETLQMGNAAATVDLVKQALDEGIEAGTILNDGLLAGMNEIGIKFKNYEVFVPEVLIAARAMKQGIEVLQPQLNESGDHHTNGVAVIGTVKGDLHDIGKNLVKIMLEGKGITVYDLGTDVDAETFIEEAINKKADLILCSALLTTTMPEMKKQLKFL